MTINYHSSLHSEIEGKHAEKAQYVAELNEEVLYAVMTALLY